MELVQHEILDTGASKNFHYYTLVCGFDINPNNGDTARDMFMHIRGIISQRAEIMDDIAIRVFRNDLSFGLTNYPSDSEDMVATQYLFSVSAHNNGWTLAELSAALGSTLISTKMRPRDGSVVIKWYESLANGMNFSVLNQTSGEYESIPKWDIKLSKSVPIAKNGSNKQMWIVPNTNGMMTFYYKDNGEWFNITQRTEVSTEEPTDNELFWFDPTGMQANIGDTIDTYSEDVFNMVLNATDGSEIRMVNFGVGIQCYVRSAGEWDPRPVDGNMVYDEYNWFNKNNENAEPTFSFEEQNEALQGTSELGGGSVEIYNYSYSPDNLIGTATALVFVDGDQRAYLGSEEGIIMVGTAPEYASNFMTSNGSTGNQSYTNINTTQVFVGDPQNNAFVAGDWAATEKPANGSDAGTWATPGLISGFGAGSTINVTVLDGDNQVIDQITDHEFTANGVATATGAGATTVTLTNYDADGADRFAANMELNIDHTAIYAGASGVIKVTITMVAAEDANTEYEFSQSYFYDADGGADPVINGAVALERQTATTKHLSGIEYMTTGERFEASALDIDGLAEDSFNSGTVISFNYGAIPIPDFTAGRAHSDWTGMTTAHDLAGASFTTDAVVSEPGIVYIGTTQPVYSVSDPWTTVPRSVTISPMLIDTVVDTSTDLVETFQSESRRLTDNWTTWNSETALIAGQALVGNQRLMVPNQLKTTVGTTAAATEFENAGYIPANAGLDYSSLDSTSGVSYKRRFVFTSSTQEFANLSINFAGEFGSHANIVEALVAGDIEIFMYKEWDTDGEITDPSLNSRPVWLHAPYSFADFNNGVTQSAGGAGVRLPTSANNTVNVSFGGFSLARSFWLDVVINSDDISLSNITVSE